MSTQTNGANTPRELHLADGSTVDLSRSGNLLRRRWGTTAADDYAARKVIADLRCAALKAKGEGPVDWKVALTIVERLQIDRLPTEGASGEPVRTEVVMTPEDALHCMRVFLHWAEAVHVLTAGEVAVQYTVRFLDAPIHQGYRDSFFFVPTQGMPEFAVEPGSVDSVFAYFKPGPVPTSMYGGTHGGDLGPGGAGTSGLALIPGRETSEWSFADTTMHEWLHQIEWATTTLLGCRGLPGTHEFADLGYPTDGDPYFVHRDLMQFVVTPGMWRRLSIRRASGHADPAAGLHEWLVLGPFDNADDQGIGRATIPEETVTPDAGETAGDRTWTVASSIAGYTDLATILSPNQQVVAYAYAYVFSPAEAPAFLAIGTDDGGRAYWNGLLVLDDHSHHAARRDASMVKIVLQKGWNRLLLKVDQGNGSWGFFARFLDFSLRPIPDLQYAARRPTDGIVQAGKAYEKTPYSLRYFSFDQVKDDPWFKLPRIDGDRLSDTLGVPGVEIHAAQKYTFLAIPQNAPSIVSPVLSGPDPSDVRLNNQLTWDRESCLHVRYKSKTGEERDLLGFRPDVLDVFLRSFRPINTPVGGRRIEDSVVGYLLESAKPIILVDTALSESPQNELELMATRSPRAELFAIAEPARVIRGRDFHVRCGLRNTGDQPAAAAAMSLALQEPGVSVGGDGMEIKGLTPGQSITTQFSLKVTSAAFAGPLLLRARAELRAEGQEPEVVEKIVALEIEDPIEIHASVRGASDRGTAVIATHETTIDVSLKNHTSEAASGTVRLELPHDWACLTAASDGGEAQPAPGNIAFHLDSQGIGRASFSVRLPETAVDRDETIVAIVELAKGDLPATEARAVVHVALGATLVAFDFENDLGVVGESLGQGFNGSGGYRVARDTQTPLSGKASAHIEDQGGSHFGHVCLFGITHGTTSAPVVYDTKDFPFLDFQAKSESDQPTALLVTVDDQVCCAMLTGEYREQWGKRTVLPALPFKPGAEPVHVVYSLDESLDKALGKKSHFVSRIDFGDPRAFASNQWTGPDVKAYWFDDFLIRR
ncbi:MAG: hypothetical protein HYR85_27815 [Planctomycetes bacterium]|nr:hypothetical protein [Planctomycetota bacterium]MBI3844211.1 hypothetical protein [Planctomycetota bacterium]